MTLSGRLGKEVMFEVSPEGCTGTNSGKLREKNFQKKGPVDIVADETGHRKACCED